MNLRDADERYAAHLLRAWPAMDAKLAERARPATVGEANAVAVSDAYSTPNKARITLADLVRVRELALAAGRKPGE